MLCGTRRISPNLAEQIHARARSFAARASPIATNLQRPLPTAMTTRQTILQWVCYISVALVCLMTQRSASVLAQAWKWPSSIPVCWYNPAYSNDPNYHGEAKKKEMAKNIVGCSVKCMMVVFVVSNAHGQRLLTVQQGVHLRRILPIPRARIPSRRLA